MADEKSKEMQIYDRKNSTLKDREKIHLLLKDSYKGGQSYIDNSYLHQHSLESDEDYKKRKTRSVFISHTKTIVDILIGFLYNNEIKRDIPEPINYLKQAANPTQDWDTFIQKTAIHSCLYTNAILVDSPSFDPDVVKSVKDREEQGLNPYCKRYDVFSICDFAFGEDGKLLWIIFDDSYVDNTDPFQKDKEIILKSVWDKEKCQKLYYKKVDDEIVHEKTEIIEHGYGGVPVVLISFRDVEDDYFCDSFSENLALLDRAIYNYMSLMEVSLAKTAIKPIMYPSKDGKVPDSMQDTGKLSKLVVIPYDATTTSKPFFLEANSTDVQGYLTAIELYLEEARQSVGLSKNNTLHGLSGKAKEKELERFHVILRQGATNLERMEKEILDLVLMIEKKEGTDVTVEYPTTFHAEETADVLQRFYDTLTLDSDTLQKKSVEEITKLVHPDMSEKEVEQVVSEYESQSSSDFQNDDNTDIQGGVPSIPQNNNNNQNDLKGDQQNART